APRSLVALPSPAKQNSGSLFSAAPFSSSIVIMDASRSISPDLTNSSDATGQGLQSPASPAAGAPPPSTGSSELDARLASLPQGEIDRLSKLSDADLARAFGLPAPAAGKSGQPAAGATGQRGAGLPQEWEQFEPI